MQSWFTQAKAVTESTDDLMPLPNSLEIQVSQHIQSLPSPQAYQAFIHESLSNALSPWQTDLDAPNSLVILGSPVESIAKIIRDGLQTWVDRPPLEIITPLSCRSRPQIPWIVTSQIRQALQPYPQINVSEDLPMDDSLDLGSLEERTTLIVIPCLEQCFLRCIGGWESIEFLRDRVIHNPNCFWLIGCNHWAWDYLDFVCQVRAYFNDGLYVPPLGGEMLQAWLDPVMKTVVAPTIDFGDRQHFILQNSTRHHQQSLTDEERHQTYWNVLAHQSLGISSMATSLWLKSLRIKNDAIPGGTVPKLELSAQESTEQPFTIHEAFPAPPSLPTLTGGDRYLLNSVLIHGHITRSHLALSLGEPESKIRAQVQSLLRAGVLDQGQGVLSVQPAYYGKIKSELANNNFFVSKN
ncbi:AsnC family protein [Candidatus Synechococcus calcipolaris G9]|uniref:AsnC family protein n=1 Tax=Candidatus Synechococcus calcipolaris G9 TaxID=1497997 RepID=A0ABT6EXZ8_9SYNE|nr:AsnC family protein [Candidatus Synechococcus calcipolaris]MDG2990674.1 AsnC family protein [Candidatus Synechococcus calcipolaris G9]